MTDRLYQELPRARRRRLIFWAVLRGVLGAAVLVVLYYVLPLDEPWNADTAVRILIGLVVFADIMVWQVRTIAGSRYPGVKAFEALGLIVPFYCPGLEFSGHHVSRLVSQFQFRGYQCDGGCVVLGAWQITGWSRWC